MSTVIENEISPETLTGSFSKDLMLSKLYLLEQLRVVLAQLDISDLYCAYILGSWYGNLSVLMALDNFPVRKTINVDKNSRYVDLSKQILNKIDSSSEHMVKDVNNLDYRQLRYPSLVVNNSCNDIAGSRWFNRIPNGTIVALDAGDQENSVNKFTSVKSLRTQYPLSTLLFSDELNLGDYRRFIVIGIK